MRIRWRERAPRWGLAIAAAVWCAAAPGAVAQDKPEVDRPAVLKSLESDVKDLARGGQGEAVDEMIALMGELGHPEDKCERLAKVCKGMLGARRRRSPRSRAP